MQTALQDSGIKNNIIIISACHSGVFIPYLQNDHTMIMTAAAADKNSFGCSDKNELTYFTEAYFTNGLSETTDLEKAFDIAKKAVGAREQAENIKQPSDPQIFVGDQIKSILRNYTNAQLASGE